MGHSLRLIPAERYKSGVLKDRMINPRIVKNPDDYIIEFDIESDPEETGNGIVFFFLISDNATVLLNGVGIAMENLMRSIENYKNKTGYIRDLVYDMREQIITLMAYYNVAVNSEHFDETDEKVDKRRGQDCLRRVRNIIHKAKTIFTQTDTQIDMRFPLFYSEIKCDILATSRFMQLVIINPYGIINDADEVADRDFECDYLILE